MKDYSNNQRKTFADEIYKHMVVNKKIWVITSDLGYGLWDRIRKDFPDRFINVGAAEQSLIGIGVGLALHGKIPVLYSITPFLLYRPFETIRNYINNEKIPVKLIGSGRNKDYEIDGPSHWAEEDRHVLKIFNHIKAFWPNNVNEIIALTNKMLEDQSPYYINLKR